MKTEMFLVDESAIIQYADVVHALAQKGQTAACSLVFLRLLAKIQEHCDRDVFAYSADALMRGPTILTTDEADLRRALEVQKLLVAAGKLGIDVAVLIIAAIAERFGMIVLTCNPHFEVVGIVTGQPVRTPGAMIPILTTLAPTQ